MYFKKSLRLKKYIFLALLITFFKYLTAYFIFKYNEKAFLYPDSFTYIKNIFGMKEFYFGFRGDPEFFRTPGYPFFLLIIDFISKFTGNFTLNAVFFNITLTFFSFLIISRIYFLLRKKISYFTLLYLIDPRVLVCDLSILSEVTYTFFLILSLFFFLIFYKERKSKHLILSSLFLGISTYVRPVSIFLSSVYFIFIMFLNEKFLYRLKKGLIYVLVHFIIIFPWFYRNYIHTGHFFFSTVGAKSLLYYNGASVKAVAEGKDIINVKKELEKKFNALKPGIREKLETKEFFKIVKKYPEVFLKLYIKGIIVELFDPLSGNFANMLKLRKKGSGILRKFYSSDFKKAFSLILKDKYFFLFEFAGLLLVLVVYAFFIIRFDTLKFEYLLFVAVFFYHILLSASVAATGRFAMPVVFLLYL